MKILWIGIIDTGGMCYTYSNAINNYTEHECRLAIQYDTRGFDSDIVFERQMWSKPDGVEKEEKVAELKKLADEADVLIFNAALFPGVASSYHNVASDTFDVNWYGIDWNKYIDSKKCFAFFLGSCSLRNNYEYYVNLHKDKGFGIITCQPDIYYACKQLYDRVDYVPILINNANPRYGKEPILNNWVTAIHSPTHRAIKNTAEFVRVCKRVCREKKNFDYSMIENVGFDESVKLKQRADIGFDQMQPDEYYCLSSVENGALGLVNIVKLGYDTVKFIEQSLGINSAETPEDSLPWFIPENEDDLYRIIKKFANEPEILYNYKIKSYHWHHKYWNDKRLITQLSSILEK